MKKASLRFFLLIIAVVFATNLFAQGLADPGSDPLKQDSAKEITTLETRATNHSKVYSAFLSEGKDPINFNKRSDTLLLRKNDEKDIQASIK
jgi:hypothetical protein